MVYGIKLLMLNNKEGVDTAVYLLLPANNQCWFVLPISLKLENKSFSL